MLQKSVRYARLLIRAFGWRGLVRRGVYLLRLHSGELARRLPAAADFTRAPRTAWSHRFAIEALGRGYSAEGLEALVRDDVVADANRVLSGQVQLYGDRWHEVGWPPRWHVNPFTGHEYPRVHWTSISDATPERGDIKDVWELSRLPFTYLFARAHVLTGDGRYVEAWWQAVEDWAACNPPNVGVNWRCGQETSLRGIALCFGLSTFADHPTSTRTRLELAERLLGASVDRVRPTVGYALSQRNNHAISELVFLLTVGAEDERKLLSLLLETLDDQFYPDGSYGQQSFTYQRLAVQALQWLLTTRPDLPPGAHSRVVDALARSRDFLARCSDPVSGWLPNYGPTDGAMLFHLSNGHYRDFRPLLASLGLPRATEHHELALWLSLPEVVRRETDASSQPSTYHTLRGPRSLAFTRVGTGRHRPGHADQQAIDLWVDGRNVILDPGTFRYTAPAPWGNALTGPDVHATLRTADAGPLSVGRFLQESGSDAELVHRSGSAEADLLVSRRPADGGWLWRALARRGDAHAVLDVADEIPALARWNFDESEGVNVAWLASGPPRSLERSDDDPASGWSSPLYGSRQPLDARETAMAPGTVSAATFTSEGQVPLSLAEMRDELSAWLPRWAVAELVGIESPNDRRIGSRDTTNTPGEA